MACSAEEALVVAASAGTVAVLGFAVVVGVNMNNPARKQLPVIRAKSRAGGVLLPPSVPRMRVSMAHIHSSIPRVRLDEGHAPFPVVWLQYRAIFGKSKEGWCPQ